MVIEFTCQISVLTLLLLFRWWDGEVYSIHFYVIKCFFYLRLVDHSVSELLSVDHSVSELLSVDHSVSELLSVDHSVSELLSVDSF
jgi:hypothetical protein